jgi:transcription-repair coupling factor (superfamily II helicase)
MEQSGFLAAVGFDMYNELLHETIAELKGEIIARPPDVELNIKADAYLPELFIPDAGERVLFYRRLSETVSVDEVRSIEEELTDRFGRPAGPAANLLDSAYIRHYAAIAGVSDVSYSEGETIMGIPETVGVTREMVERMVAKSPVKLNFSFHKGMRIAFTVSGDGASPLNEIKKVLQVIAC